MNLTAETAFHNFRSALFTTFRLHLNLNQQLWSMKSCHQGFVKRCNALLTDFWSQKNFHIQEVWCIPKFNAP